MATVGIDIDLPAGVTVTHYERVGDGHGFEVSWPLPDRCRCDACRREEPTQLEFKDGVQVVRDLDIWGQPSFWVYRPAYHRCSFCNHRPYVIPPFKRKDVSYTYRFEQLVLRLLIGSNEAEVGRRLGISAEAEKKSRGGTRRSCRRRSGRRFGRGCGSSGGTRTT
jgi:hypothetical protein